MVFLGFFGCVFLMPTLVTVVLIWNHVGIGFSCLPASLYSLATQFQTRFLESIPRPIRDFSFWLCSFAASAFRAWGSGTNVYDEKQYRYIMLLQCLIDTARFTKRLKVGWINEVKRHPYVLCTVLYNSRSLAQKRYPVVRTGSAFNFRYVSRTKLRRGTRRVCKKIQLAGVDFPACFGIKP